MAETVVTKLCFFSLPLELRDEIYQLAVSPDSEGCIHEPPILHNVCHQMRYESIKWIRDAFGHATVVFHYSSLSETMDSSSLALLQFCRNLEIDDKPLFNHVDQFHLSFEWVENATNQEGQPRFCLDKTPVIRCPGLARVAAGPVAWARYTAQYAHKRL